MPQAAQDRPTKPLLQAQAAAGLGPTRQSRWPCRAPLGGLAPRGPLGKAAALCRKALQPAGSAGPERPRRPVRTTPGPRVRNGRRVTDAEATAAPPTSSGVTRPPPPEGPSSPLEAQPRAGRGAGGPGVQLCPPQRSASAPPCQMSRPSKRDSVPGRGPNPSSTGAARSRRLQREGTRRTWPGPRSRPSPRSRVGEAHGGER